MVLGWIIPLCVGLGIEPATFRFQSKALITPHVHISVGNGLPVAVQALVVDGELLGYDLLLGTDSIMQLGGITVNSTGNIRFSRGEKHVCAAITLDEPDFHTKYDRDTNAWTASWKWSGDQLQISLRNWQSEYPPPTWLREQHVEELQAWIDKGLIPLIAVL